MKMYLRYLFRLKAGDLLRMHRLCFLMVFSLLLTSLSGSAQVVLSLDHQVKAGSPSSTPSGVFWTMQLNYSVSSTTGSASGVKMTINLPDYIYSAEGMVGTTHAPVEGFVYSGTPGAKKLTITFIDPVPSGSTGVLEYRLRTLNGSTPDGTIIEPCAEMTDGSGATSGIKCGEMPIIASNRLCGFKVLKVNGAIGHPVTYRIYLGVSSGNPSNASNGSLNASDVSITDYYPAGATLVSAKAFNRNDVELTVPITYGTNSVTAQMPDHVINTINNALSMSYLEVTLRYDEPAFNTTTPITNRASITYTPLGGSSITLDENSGANGTFCTSDLIETHTLEVPDARAVLVKSLRTASPVFAGGTVEYNINFSNTGNVALDNVVVIENVPADLTFANLRLDASGSQVQSVHYQTNLNASWVSLPTGAAPVLPAGEKIIKIRFTLISPYNPGQTFSGTNILRFVTNSDITEPTTVQNCFEWTTTTSGINTDAVCNNNLQVNPESTTARVVYSSAHSPRCGTIFSVGMDLTISGVIRSETGYAGVENPVAAFFVPQGFQYIAGSENFNPQTSGFTGTPVLTIIEDFIDMEGIMYDMYKWTFPVGTTVPSGTEMGLSVKLKITNQVPGGTDQSIRFVVDGSNVSSRSTGDTYGFTFTDINDWDGDGNTTEQFRVSRTSHLSCALNISASASMESIKWVKGSLDTDYSRYPATGSTVPGGNADYKLIVANKGNVPMKDIKIIDILPFVGDRGVIDPQARLTEWRPNLAAPISAPAGIVVSYSTEQNPCRDELRQPGDPSPFPTGCVTAGWSTTPPADITRVQSVKIDFGSTVLAVGDSLIFSWPMRAPVTAPTNGEIAWNSFGFVATRTDNNQPLIAAEPIKVGIEVVTGLPAHYGDRVWYDDNRNGIQDEGEAGVNGVTVHLYAPAVAGVQNPAVDSLVNFTITGNNGLYKFSNLTPGEYYAVFFVPSGFSISPDNQGANDAIDSDGIPGTVDGQTVTIVPITTLEEDEEDYTWDQGIYCLLTPTVTPVQVVAAEGSATLTATGGTSYLWTGPNGFTASTASITINPVTPADTGTYVVTIMDGECRASLSTEIQIENCAVIAVPQTTSQTICAGESATLSGTCVSPATIVWYSDSGLTTELNSTTINPAITTTYYAVCKDADCISEESTQTIVTVTPAEQCACSISATVEAACHNNGTLEDTSDDYMSFLLTPSGGKLGGRFTLTATQGGSPIVVTLSDGTAHTELSYAYPTPFRTPVGSAGEGNIILTLTDTEDADCNTTVTVTDKGVCGTDECVGDTPRTVTYTYRTPFQTTDLQNVGIVIPKFNEADKTLTQVEIKYGIEEANNYIVENTADRDQNYKLDVEMLATIKMDSDTLEHISETYEGEVVRLASYIDVAAQGNYTGDVPYGSSTPPRLSTIRGMGVWLSNLMADIYVDPKQDPRWVTNATGNASHDDDIYVKGTDEIVAEGEKVYTSAADIAQFLGSGNLPLTASTLNSHSITGGGGNNVWLLRTKAFAYATVTYTYMCNSCETPDAGVDIAMDCEEELPATVVLTGAPAGGTWSVDPSNPSGTAVSGAGVASGFTTAGTYKFIYSVSQGGEVCTDTVQVLISLKPAPPVLTPVEVCQGETVELEGTCSGSGSIKWYSNVELTNEVKVLSFAGTESRTYYAVCADGECTSSSTSVEVIVNTTPTISIAGPAVCATDGLTYSATVTTTAGAVITTSAGVVNGNTVSGIPSGVTATITATIGTCSDSTTVSQNCTVPCEAPNPTVTGSATVCEGESATLEASGCTTGYTYLWSTGATTATVTVTPTATTTYTVVCVDSDLAGCESTAAGEATVTVTEVPTISIAGPAVCAADGLTYSATVTATAGAIITTSAGVVSGNTVSGIPSGVTATITATIGTCSDSTTVSQNCTVPCEAPNPTVTGSATVCEGESATLEASGCTTGYTYLWSTEATTASVTVTPTATTKYTVVCVDSDLAGCESTTPAEAVVTVTEKTAAPTGVTASPSEIISGETSELSATCAAGLTSHWFTDGELTTELTSTTVSPVTTTTYYVICGEDKECAIPSQVIVTVTDEPLVFDLALRKTMAPGSKTIYKVGDEVTFNITVFNQGTVTATSVDLVDYIPAGLTLEDDNWTLDGDKARWIGAISNLAAGAQQTVQITFIINSSATGVVVNTAEISGATNPENLEDKDSTPDEDKDNDGDVKNDEIDEDGKNNPNDDEDDHDIEPITICPDAKCLNVKTVRKK